MQKQQVLSKKVVRTLLAMSFVYSGGMFVADGMASAAMITTPQNFDNNSTYSDQNYVCNGVIYAEAQVFTDDLDIEVSGAGESALSLLVDYNSDGTALVTKGNVRLKAAADAYALLVGTMDSGDAKHIIVNTDNDKTVQITGDVGLQDLTENGIVLNLSSADSFWAGKLVYIYDGSGWKGNKAIFDFRLSNQAVWYAGADSFDISDKKNISLKSDGGIIDLYHSQPGTVRSDTAPRAFEIKTNAKTSIKNTTFVIGADLEAKTNDTVKLTGTNSNSGSNITNYIQMVMPQEVNREYLGKKLKIDKTVVTLDGTEFTTDNTIFKGQAVGAARIEFDGGLTVIKDFSMTPDLVADGTDKWKIDTVTVNGTVGKGGAMTLAESGVGAAAAVLQANSNDLLRRLGELRGNVDETGAWARAYGGETGISSGVDTDLKYHTFQGGYDWNNDLKNGKLVTGLAVSYLKGESSFEDGSGDNRSTMFGLYSSYVGDKGHYTDLVAKYGRISHDATAVTVDNTYTGDFDSNAFTLSAEYGYRQQLNNGYFIEPQAELTYGNLAGSDYTISSGAKVHNDAYRSLIGRVGFNIGRQNKDNNFYLKCSLAHEFQGDMNMTAGYKDVSMTSNIDMQDTWLEYGVGFNSKLDKNVNLYGELERSTGSAIKTKWRGNIGLRCTF